MITRFGTHGPPVHRLIEELSAQRGEAIMPSGAGSANALGLTTQVPARLIYWTSGRSRKLTLGKLVIHLAHVPLWQLAFANELAGEIVRAMAWAGPERVRAVLKGDRGKGSQNRDS